MALCMFLLAASRLGSLHRLEKCRCGKLWRALGAKGRLPKADQLGRMAAMLRVADIRRHLRHVYARQKRAKALRPAVNGNLFSLVIDGHECCASYLRCCKDCLRRRIGKGTPRERTQYYHRLVMAVLVCERSAVLLDIELQRPGEGEVHAAIRLLERVCADYPRAFDLVVADGLYAQAPFFKRVRAAGKHAIAVLKDEQRDLVGDVEGLCRQIPPCRYDTPHTQRQVWDIENLQSWPQVGMPVRVVRSIETTVVRHQRAASEVQTSTWMWVTTIPRAYLSTAAFIDVAHDRWDIENRAFNELVSYWHTAHVYTHHTNAMLVFWLMTMLAYNIFHAFFFGNLKPPLQRRGKYRIADDITAQLLLADLPSALRDP